MEFWGVEVKAEESLKVQPEFSKLIHISQAALGEVKDIKGAKHVPIRMKLDEDEYVIGTLSAEDRPQMMLDLVIERKFELSHDWKSGSVYFIGSIADDQIQDEQDFSDESDDRKIELRLLKMVVCQQSLSLSPVLSLIGFFHSSDMQNEKLLFRFVNFTGKPQPKVEDVKPTKDKATAAKTGTKKEDASDSDGMKMSPFSLLEEFYCVICLNLFVFFLEIIHYKYFHLPTSVDSLLVLKEQQPMKRPSSPVSNKKAKLANPGNASVHIATLYPYGKAGKTPTGNKTK
ncbi:histone deacetylase HDT1-like [Olea europaea var. sylvestris]|uniref:histone deacetylase HDT1-like n=1 Tax=Olea europaea var. sylvestris TaxID=158386 RepID=UPI000C1CF395|nr:histone deacetylase HDT1-like [Olea europaea var. sylvestris]